MIEIADYNLQWPHQFAALSTVLTNRLNKHIVTIEHVGSTAVPGLAAKPILDITLVMSSIQSLPGVIDLLRELGYEHQGDLGIAGRHAFRYESHDVPRNGTGQTWPAHHLYACSQDNPQLLRQRAFRDHLRQHPGDAKAYEDLKRLLAQCHSADRAAYTQAKTEFIEAILRRTEIFTAPHRGS